MGNFNKMLEIVLNNPYDYLWFPYDFPFDFGTILDNFTYENPILNTTHSIPGLFLRHFPRENNPKITNKTQTHVSNKQWKNPVKNPGNQTKETSN